MSRLTASPFHKPSPYEFPRGGRPISPPDTDSEVGAQIRTGPPAGPNAVMYGEEFEQTASQTAVESPAARFRRVSTLAYHSSGLRESRERSASRNSKALVIVIPPESLAREHGPLGHTLSFGSRLTQGVLLPLMPSLSVQLTAIAREFNFPSTAGLCLYLSVTENGLTFTPRITDESWPILWSQSLEAGATASSGPHGLPLAGKIEFDIDTRKARWYTAWITAALREHSDHDLRSISHWRGDSKTTFAEDHVPDDVSERPSVAQQPHRHVPKKLSLVDRFDLSSHRTAPTSDIPPQSTSDVQVVPVLSPIVQAEEPQTAKQKLENKVKSWRASASLASTPLPAVSGLEEALPDINSVPQEEEDVQELNLDDFTWSVSSAGPPSVAINSPASPYRLPSIHIDRRMANSVSLTPTTCTSFGPFDYGMHSPMTDISLVRTPDIGQRMVDNSPLTPSTATTWGAPLSWPATPFSDVRPRSIHLGDRMQFSRPVTPSTATTWGAPLTYPPSPATPYHVNTPDAGQRAFDKEEQECFPGAGMSEYPYLNICERTLFLFHHTTTDIEADPDVITQLARLRVPAGELALTSRRIIKVKIQVVYPLFDICEYRHRPLALFFAEASRKILVHTPTSISTPLYRWDLAVPLVRVKCIRLTRRLCLRPYPLLTQNRIFVRSLVI
ncbi:hypothetical protein HWV62_7138 [Athelia sp. TMB]|nr:hypothetical protein HWV62_7138 [Athelia sp. TMB]